MRELGLPSAQLNPTITVETAMAGAAFATATPRDLAEAFTFLDDHAKEMLFRQQHQDFLPRRLPHAADAADVGIEMPLRVYNKTGGGLGTCIDSGLFETATARWVVAAMAGDQTDFARRPDDVAPQAFARIGELLFEAWGEVAPTADRPALFGPPDGAVIQSPHAGHSQRRRLRPLLAARPGTDQRTVRCGGGKGERAVASYDEDTTTMGVEAARLA